MESFTKSRGYTEKAGPYEVMRTPHSNWGGYGEGPANYALSNRLAQGRLYEQGRKDQNRALIFNTRAMKEGVASGIETLQAGIPAFEAFAAELGAGVDATIGSYMAEVESAVDDADEARIRALGYVNETLPEILREYEQAYTGGMEQLAEFKANADPRKLMDLGWGGMELEFDKFKQDATRQLTDAGISPQVLRGQNERLASMMLDAGAGYAGQMTELSMGLGRQAAQMGIDIEGQRGLRKGLARETATGRKVGIETDMARLGSGLKMEGARNALGYTGDIQKTRLGALNAAQSARAGIAGLQVGGPEKIASLTPDYVGQSLGYMSLLQPMKLPRGSDTPLGGSRTLRQKRPTSRPAPAYSQSALYARS